MSKIVFPELAKSLADSTFKVIESWPQPIKSDELIYSLIFHNLYIVGELTDLDYTNIDTTISYLEKAESHDAISPMIHSYLLQTLLTLRNFINYKRGTNG
jgi:hypothetical protein